MEILELITRVLMKIVQNQAKIFLENSLEIVKLLFHLCHVRQFIAKSI